MVIYHRRKVILAILEKIGGSTTAKSMQKYLLLFTRASSGEQIYDFIPHKYGCFSFVANNDIQALAHQGLITIKEKPNQESEYTLTQNNNFFNQLDLFCQAAVRYVVDTFGGLSQDELIAYTYRRWPFTAINSLIKERLLTQEELEKVESIRLRYIQNVPLLMTLGYEGISIEKYMTTMISNGVKVLCDVRKNAFSQKYGFSKSTLKAACEAVNIKYVHLPQLGIESNKRKSLNTQADYDALFYDYESTTLKDNYIALLSLRDIVNDNNRVCLLCFERDPRQCHRTRIANAVIDLPGSNFKYSPILL